MNKIPLIVANWKMYKTSAEAYTFIQALIQQDLSSKRQIFITPAFTAIASAVEAAKGSQVVIGAQTMHEKLEGAFTGEISARMIKELGAAFVILGHSERRQYCAETDVSINKKIHLALQENLIPILCIGESLQERENNNQNKILREQLEICLKDLSQLQASQVILAYEPIWAIGTGKTATAHMAQETHLIIRLFLKERFGLECSQKIRILYGGSVNPSNIAALMEQTDIDGVLVGGASLDLCTFINIVNF